MQGVPDASLSINFHGTPEYLYGTLMLLAWLIACLQGVLDVPLYGRVAALQLFRPAGEPRDLLLLLTERNNFCVLGFDEESGEAVFAFLFRQCECAVCVGCQCCCRCCRRSAQQLLRAGL